VSHRYDLIAIDLDGTLLDSTGRVSPRCAEAIGLARAAGITVTVCTGRGLKECAFALEQIEQLDPVVVAGGSIVACPRERRTLHRFPMDPELVRRTVDQFVANDHPVLVLKDTDGAGYDYLVVVGEDEHPLDPVTRWWFESMRVSVRTVRSLDEDEHPEHSVRVGVCGVSSTLTEMVGILTEVVGDRVTMHNFPAVVAPEHARAWGGERTINILELFDREANKWSAITRVANDRGIEARRIAAIGDQVNDVAMLEGAALGIAMGNAVDDVRRVADRQTRTNDEGGVAHAIEQILSGAW